MAPLNIHEIDVTRCDSAVSADDYSNFPVQQPVSGIPSLCRPQQHASGHEQIDQSTSHKQAVGILVQPAITDLCESEDPLENQKRMLETCTPWFRPDGKLHGSAPDSLRYGSMILNTPSAVD